MEESRSLPALGAAESHQADALLDELGARAAAADRDAFGQLYTLLVDDIYGYVRGQCRDDLLAEDLVAETFLRAWRFGPSYKRRAGHYRRWLFRIARNQVRTYWSTSRPETVLLEDALASPDRESGQAVPAAAVVASALSILTDDQRDAIVLRYIESLPYEEIATLMGKRPGAVRALVNRGLRRMRKVIDDAAP